MENEQFERFKELEKAHKKELRDVFSKLASLTKPCHHLFRKTTFKVEMPLPEWYAFEKSYVGEDNESHNHFQAPQ